MFGVTPTGFVPKTIEDILSEIEADQKQAFGAGLDVSAETPIGQINGIMAAKFAELWEVSQAVDANQDPDTATDAGLDGVAAITGTLREGDTLGTVSLLATLSGVGPVPAGSVVQVLGDPTNRWVLDTAAGPGPGAFAVQATAETAGRFVATAGAISVIVTPVAGWDSVTNPLDATPGEDADTDAELRLRREQELQGAGPTVNAIRAQILGVDGVTSATVLQNVTDLVDAFGLLPHSIRAIVSGGVDAEIAQAIFDNLAAGINTNGATLVLVEDSEGISHNIRLDRPTVVPILIEVDVDVDADDYPVDGDDLIDAALIAYQEASIPPGEDVFRLKLVVPICTVAGVVNVTRLQISIDPAAVADQDIAIALDEAADFDTTRITVVSTPV
jgi:uncharacterized phage protein gp47/JayE